MAYSAAIESPALPEAESGKFLQLQVLRGIFGALITIFLCRTLDFGLNATVLVLAVLIGNSFAGRLLKAGRGFGRVLTEHAVVFAGLYLILRIANFLLTSTGSSPASDFLIPRFADDLLLVCVFYSIAFLSSWFFWTRSQAVTIEGVVGASLLVWLLSSHRNYHIDAPRQISSLTWKLGWLQRLNAEPQHLFLALGGICTVLLAGYFVLAHNRPLFGRAPKLKAYGPTQKFLALVCPLVVLMSLFYYAQHLNARYAEEEKRNSNGVGQSQNAKEGESNLGFHQAISPTRQPSALVRLESDYSRNPSAPMLYLREGALSSFNGRELVNAGPDFDTDVPRIGVGQPYLSANSELGEDRQKVMQSVYLLTQHKVPFALDIPRRIAPIQNPYPDRFRAAYQVLSYAPVTPVEELAELPIGSSEWDQKTLEHYLRAPGSLSIANFLPEMVKPESLVDEEPVLDEHGEDLRYARLAKMLGEGFSNPVLKAAAIIDFLSEQSIYTRNPGHQVNQKGDPVAPYLFAKEKRGYCVHFSHAAVYMLRLAGIPARIGTGYLTDLTYAKDGHILLQTGDRHAWPEIYVEGKGWVVFDITPARAENEQALVPDENLLDELMSKLNPVQELLDPVPVDTPEEERNILIQRILNAQALGGLLLAMILAFLGTKAWLRHGYRVANDDRRRAQLAYTSFLSLMADCGLYRYRGETRQEYASRLHTQHGIDSTEITKLHELTAYGRPGWAPEKDELSGALERVERSFDASRSKLRRWISFFNPWSLSRYRSW